MRESFASWAASYYIYERELCQHIDNDAKLYRMRNIRRISITDARAYSRVYHRQGILCMGMRSEKVRAGPLFITFSCQLWNCIFRRSSGAAQWPRRIYSIFAFPRFYMCARSSGIKAVLNIYLERADVHTYTQSVYTLLRPIILSLSRVYW